MTQSINRLVASKLFHHFIVAVIVLAGVLAGFETSLALMAAHGALFHALDRLILGVFIVEALLKMAAHGRRPWRNLRRLVIAWSAGRGTRPRR